MVNDDTLKSIEKATNKFREQLLFKKDDFDEKSAWMFIMTFINELTKYEIEKRNTEKTVYS